MAGLGKSGFVLLTERHGGREESLEQAAMQLVIATRHPANCKNWMSTEPHCDTLGNPPEVCSWRKYPRMLPTRVRKIIEKEEVREAQSGLELMPFLIENRVSAALPQPPNHFSLIRRIDPWNMYHCLFDYKHVLILIFVEAGSVRFWCCRKLACAQHSGNVNDS